MPMAWLWSKLTQQPCEVSIGVAREGGAEHLSSSEGSCEAASAESLEALAFPVCQVLAPGVFILKQLPPPGLSDNARAASLSLGTAQLSCLTREAFSVGADAPSRLTRPRASLFSFFCLHRQIRFTTLALLCCSLQYCGCVKVEALVQL